MTTATTTRALGGAAAAAVAAGIATVLLLPTAHATPDRPNTDPPVVVTTNPQITLPSTSTAPVPTGQPTTGQPTTVTSSAAPRVEALPPMPSAQTSASATSTTRKPTPRRVLPGLALDPGVPGQTAPWAPPPVGS